MTYHICNVADQFCTHPANGERTPILRTECYACGLPVCKNCSVRTTYYNYGTKRLCHTCLEAYQGNEQGVMSHLTRLAKRPL